MTCTASLWLAFYCNPESSGRLDADVSAHIRAAAFLQQLWAYCDIPQLEWWPWQWGKEKCLTVLSAWNRQQEENRCLFRIGCINCVHFIDQGHLLCNFAMHSNRSTTVASGLFAASLPSSSHKSRSSWVTVWVQCSWYRNTIRSLKSGGYTHSDRLLLNQLPFSILLTYSVTCPESSYVTWRLIHFRKDAALGATNVTLTLSAQEQGQWMKPKTITCLCWHVSVPFCEF